MHGLKLHCPLGIPPRYFRMIGITNCTPRYVIGYTGGWVLCNTDMRMAGVRQHCGLGEAGRRLTQGSWKAGVNSIYLQ